MLLHITPGKRETFGYSSLSPTWLLDAGKPTLSQTHGRLKKSSDGIAGSRARNPSATEATCIFFRHAPGLELEPERTRGLILSVGVPNSESLGAAEAHLSRQGDSRDKTLLALADSCVFHLLLPLPFAPLPQPAFTWPRTLLFPFPSFINSPPPALHFARFVFQHDLAARCLLIPSSSRPSLHQHYLPGPPTIRIYITFTRFTRGGVRIVVKSPFSISRCSWRGHSFSVQVFQQHTIDVARDRKQPSVLRGILSLLRSTTTSFSPLLQCWATASPCRPLWLQ